MTWRDFTVDYHNKNWNPTWVCSVIPCTPLYIRPQARIVLNCWSSKRSDHTLCQTMFDIIISVKMCCTWTPARGWLNYVCVYPNMLRQHHIITNVYSKPATATTAETAPSIDEPRPESVLSVKGARVCRCKDSTYWMRAACSFKCAHVWYDDHMDTHTFTHIERDSARFCHQGACIPACLSRMRMHLHRRIKNSSPRSWFESCELPLHAGMWCLTAAAVVINSIPIS